MGLDASKFEGGLKKAKGGLTDLKGGLSDAVQGMTGISLSSFGAAAAFGALAKGIQFSVSEAMAAEKIDAQLNAVLASTGGVAGLTAGELEKLASSLSNMSAVEDDTIKAGEAVMLTFTKVGKEVFPQAMEAALNMSAALGGDLQSNVIQLGKALNDPEKGMTALTRSGVSFTQQQKDMIKTLQESGDMLGAQKIILGELSTEFGGAAAAAADTYAGKLEKLKNSLGNVAEEIGGALIPSLTNAADALLVLVNWNGAVSDAYAEHKEQVTQTAATYEEYRNELIRAAEAAGMWDINMTTAEMEGMGAATEEAAGKLGIMTEAQWEGVRAAQDWQSDVREAGKAAQIAAGGVQELADATGETSVNMDAVMGSLDNVTTKMLFQKAAANLDAGAALELGRSMGLVNEASYAALSGLDALREKYDSNADGAIDAAEAASGYSREVSFLADQTERLMSQPDTKNFDLNLSVNGLSDMERALQLINELGGSDVTAGTGASAGGGDQVYDPGDGYVDPGTGSGNVGARSVGPNTRGGKGGDTYVFTVLTALDAEAVARQVLDIIQGVR